MSTEICRYKVASDKPEENFTDFEKVKLKEAKDWRENRSIIQRFFDYATDRQVEETLFFCPNEELGCGLVIDRSRYESKLEQGFKFNRTIHCRCGCAIQNFVRFVPSDEYIQKYGTKSRLTKGN